MRGAQRSTRSLWGQGWSRRPGGRGRVGGARAALAVPDRPEGGARRLGWLWRRTPLQTSRLWTQCGFASGLHTLSR